MNDIPHENHADEEIIPLSEPPLPEALAGYDPVPREDFEERLLDYQAAATEHDILLARLEILDLQWKLRQRPKVKSFFFRMLVLQNLGVFGLVLWELKWGDIGAFQPLFSVLVGATLVETAAIVKYIVEFLFSVSDYKNFLTKRD